VGCDGVAGLAFLFVAVDKLCNGCVQGLGWVVGELVLQEKAGVLCGCVLEAQAQLDVGFGV
jgi:hypothetical protein